MQTLVGWHIEMEFREEGAKTAAVALVRLPDGTELRSQGYTSKHPNDPDLPRVGEELAAARALNDLAGQLLAKARGELQEETHIPNYPLM
ncbi:DUF1876 domain-containing protein [Streptacidiphilus monticola]|uniref:DUF1876 domain-containing protein n=1 Tax=Streptacidiphilus monticola TaxID=2161674 RepID=A0ABW1FUU3_9ACTN